VSGASVVLALVVPGAGPVALQERVKLDPREVASPSGAVMLFVDPSRPGGAGAAQYRCRRGTNELWAGERPWTLWEAVVGDDGVVAGYAYGNGHDGGGKDDAFTLVILAPDGTARLEQRLPREGFRSDLGMPEPMANGCFLDPDNGRFVVRVRADGFGPEESWWSYALADGAAGPRLDPRASVGANDHFGPLIAARAVPGTGLALAEWLHSDWDKDWHGLVFALLDHEGHSVWRLDWLQDLGRQPQEWPLASSILAVSDGRFELHARAKNERVIFAVERTSGARESLSVCELARAPFESSSPGGATASKAPQPAPALALEHLGTIDLSAVASRSPIHDVLRFALDDHGRIGFVRNSPPNGHFVRVDADGQNVRQVSLPLVDESEWLTHELAWSSGDRWILSACLEYGRENTFWLLDAASGELTPQGGFRGGEIESLAAFPDGGFAASTGRVFVFDAEGKPSTTWRNDLRESGESLDVLSTGELVLMSEGGDGLTFLSREGELLGKLELSRAWGREPNYLSSVHADLDGGVIVHDHNGKPPIVHMKRDGTVVAEFQPRHPDGRTFLIRRGVRAAPDGSCWASDGQALLQLGADGVVQRVLGPSPDPSELGKIARIAIGPGDRIHALDPRTGAVHVFAPDGQRLHVCEPEAQDFEKELMLPSLSVDDSGDVLVDGLGFAADGTRLGFLAWPKAGLRLGSSPDFHARRGAKGAWVVGYEQLHLVAADGTIERTIERGSDGSWLRELGTAAVAPDGSFALATGLLYRKNPGLHLFSATGEGLRRLEPPEGMASWAPFAYDGQRIAIGLSTADERPGSIVLLDADGRELGRFTPPGEVTFWIPYFAAGGRELWLFDLGYRLERYALP
jgi:hypothetical protein